MRLGVVQELLKDGLDRDWQGSIKHPSELLLSRLSRRHRVLWRYGAYQRLVEVSCSPRALAAEFSQHADLPIEWESTDHFKNTEII